MYPTLNIMSRIFSCNVFITSKIFIKMKKTALKRQLIAKFITFLFSFYFIIIQCQTNVKRNQKKAQKSGFLSIHNNTQFTCCQMLSIWRPNHAQFPANRGGSQATDDSHLVIIVSRMHRKGKLSCIVIIHNTRIKISPVIKICNHIYKTR